MFAFETCKKLQIAWICVLFWSMSLSWLIYNVKYYHQDVPQRRVRMMQNASHGQHLPQALYIVFLMEEFVTNFSQTNSACNGLKKTLINTCSLILYFPLICIKLDTAHLNLVSSNSWLFLTETYLPWICFCFVFFQSFIIDGFELCYFELFAISN